MGCDEELYTKLLNSFNLLCHIVRQPHHGQKPKVDLNNIEKIINKKIPDSLKKFAPDDFFELYMDFKSEYEKFRNFILYDKLIGKNIVALGGGFSSGKSSFLNVIMGKTVLPSDIDPSTSVPTYIVSGDKHEVEAINTFDAKVQMQPRDIKRIAHGFGELEDEDDGKVTDGVTLGHVLNNIFFSTPLHKYGNIAFLDTPGYSKPDSEKYSAKTDEQIARGQLNSSNYILWFVQADAGTITEEDIKFIKTLREDIPKLIIVNKADKKNLADLKEIIAKIKSVLELKGIRYEDVFAFSCRSEQVQELKLKSYIDEESVRIKRQVESWNKQIYESNFAKNFKALFVRCKGFYEDAIDAESSQLTRLNTSITKLIGEGIASETLEPLQLMVREAQKNVNSLKDVSKKLKELQDEFFSEIKLVADIVGIAMPEPSEIDLIQDKIQNPLQLIEDYKKKKGIKTNPAIFDILEEFSRTLSKDRTSKLPEYMSKNRTKSPPIGNRLIENVTDFIKNGYFKMLAVVLIQGGDIENSQSSIFERLIAGAHAELQMNAYLRQALELEIAAYVDFTDQYKVIGLKYRFILDTLILTAGKEQNGEQLKLIACFMESLKLNLDEVSYLTKLAKSILEQNPDIYVSAEAARPNSINYELFLDYTELFVKSCVSRTDDAYIIQNKNTYIFQSVSKKQITLPTRDNSASYAQLKVTFRNMIINVQDYSLIFEGNDAVILESCEFIGKNFPVEFKNCKDVTIRNCTFKNFESRAIVEKELASVLIEKCKFVNCMITYTRDRGDWEELGSVIYTEDRSKNAMNVIVETEFRNCGGVNKRWYHSSAVISNCSCYVKLCKFYDCWHYSCSILGSIGARKDSDNSGGFKDPDDDRRTLFPAGTRGEGNEIVNSAKIG